jgi:hypothetical protein
MNTPPKPRPTRFPLKNSDRQPPATNDKNTPAAANPRSSGD